MALELAAGGHSVLGQLRIPVSLPRGSEPNRTGAGRAAAGRVFRGEHGRLIAWLVRRFGDIGIAGAAAGEAIRAALEQRGARHQGGLHARPRHAPRAYRPVGVTTGYGACSSAATRRSHLRHGSR